MWTKLKISLENGEKTEEIEMGSSDAEERGKRLESHRAIIIKQFAMRLNLHGFRYCFDNKIYRRILWIILLLMSMGIFVYFLCAIIRIYLTYPFYTASTKKPTESLEFPAITICNRNYMKFSKMNGTILDTYIKTRGRSNITAQDYMSTMFNASHRIEDMIHSCRFGRWYTCYSSDFTAFHLKNGDKCFTLNYSEIAKRKLPWQAETKSGLFLRMIIHIEHHDYYGTTDHAGIYLIIHGADEIPSQREGHLIAPGFFTHVDVKKHQTKYLPPPYTDCGTIQLKYFTKYTVQHCYLELLTNHMVDRCGCRDFFMPGEHKVCPTFAELHCLWIEWERFDKSYKPYLTCPLPCVVDTYSSTFSYAMFPSNNAADRMAKELNHTKGTIQERRQFIRENYLKLEIDHSDGSYEFTELIPFYNAVNFLGTIGGLMALFIGASVLTYVELIDFIFSMLLNKWKRKQRNRCSCGHLW